MVANPHLSLITKKIRKSVCVSPFYFVCHILSSGVPASVSPFSFFSVFIISDTRSLRPDAVVTGGKPSIMVEILLSAMYHLHHLYHLQER